MVNIKNHYRNNNKFSKICQVGWRSILRNLILIFFILILVKIPAGQAGLIDELNRQIEEQSAKQKELEKQAKEYQKVIDVKRGEIKTLNNEIAIFNAQIRKLEIEEELTEDKISQTQLEILRLGYGLDQAEEDIVSQKEILGEIIRTIDQYDETNDLEIILQSDNLSDFFSQMAYIEGLQTKTQESIDNLKYLKNKMSQDKESEEDKKEELEGLKKQLSDKQNSLNSQRISRQTFLDYTKGEEKKYQQLLANIEAQKRSILGDLNRLIQLKADELARLKEQQEKPPQEYWASLDWYYNQTNPAWAKTTIGITNSTLADYGCAVADVAMVFSYLGERINPAQLAKEPIFSYDLIVWPKKWNSIQCLNCPPPHKEPIDWFRLDREIGAGYPVIVFVKANGRGAGHYVVVHHKTKDGRYVVHDPMFGPNIYLDSTRAYISSLYKTTTSIDQMIIYR